MRVSKSMKEGRGEIKGKRVSERFAQKGHFGAELLTISINIGEE